MSCSGRIALLNEQTVRGTEVLGVEVRRYVGQDDQALVPTGRRPDLAVQQTKVAAPKESYSQLLRDAAPDTRTVEQVLRR